MSEQWSDEELLARLGAALNAVDSVPRDFVEAAKTAFAWRNIDAELAEFAELAYDSEFGGENALALTRAADSASLRALTFVSRELTIEIEVTEDTLIGQLVPPQPGRIHLRAESGAVCETTIDEVGFFAIGAKPAERFRLHCRTATGIAVSTGWITL
ncbi:hypothetical protein C1I98_08215 [Spongiactinospora gelatinilytica]|uniref:Uncharacterized protein n=1 Tax=Spongiactinospora gelatinilytica TaxID=2666298 RepID=A0A2W2GPU9_9ACTN|nr:hypothetical protein [Spongiactinospora gelatinilytica]PZG51546.1 hypothetical protein C1I98_08215 [Spongiactinospora gelatinilytica]